LIDDVAFAKYWVENREQFKPRAARALRFELKRKGLANTDIAEAVGEIDESESAYRAAQARAPRWSGLERREFLDKLTAFLVRRGFGYAVAKDAAKRAWDESRATDSEAEMPH
jgi:regulatory protein